MSEIIGQKPTNKNCRMCGVDLVVDGNITKKRFNKSMYFCQACERIEMQQRQMYVNGKYIKKDHPLHKAGTYKGFTGAAFTSLHNYAEAKEGQVYIIYNPSFPNWCKVGMAVDAEDRLKQYQTSSPHRDYKLVKCYDAYDRRETESKAHAELEKHYKRKGEWFMCSGYKAQKILDNMLQTETEGEQLGLF